MNIGSSTPAPQPQYTLPFLSSLSDPDTKLPPAVEALLNKRPGHLVHNGRLSPKRLRDIMGLTKGEAAADPTFRAVASAVEGRLRDMGLLPGPVSDCLDGLAEQLAAKAVLHDVRSRTDLLAKNRSLYETISAHPQREAIYARAGIINLRGGLTHLSDAEIIARCAGYQSLTDLHYRCNSLAREVRQRRLTQQVVRTCGWLTFGYITPSGIMTRSYQEAVLINLLAANDIAADYDGIVPDQERDAGRKPIRYDLKVMVNGTPLYIEALQSPPGRNSCARHARYHAQWAEKQDIYWALHLDPVVVCMEAVPKHAKPSQEEVFAQEVAAALAKRGLFLAVPDRAILARNTKLDVLQLSFEAVIENLLADCAGIADLQNRRSTINNALKQRDDYELIRDYLKRRSFARRAAANRRRHAANRAHQWGFLKARAFARALGLSSQKEWHDWCAGRCPDLQPRPPQMPTNPANTYPGQYKGLGDFLGYAPKRSA